MGLGDEMGARAVRATTGKTGPILCIAGRAVGPVYAARRRREGPSRNAERGQAKGRFAV